MEKGFKMSAWGRDHNPTASRSALGMQRSPSVFSHRCVCEWQWDIWDSSLNPGKQQAEDLVERSSSKEYLWSQSRGASVQGISWWLPLQTPPGAQAWQGRSVISSSPSVWFHLRGPGRPARWLQPQGKLVEMTVPAPRAGGLSPPRPEPKRPARSPRQSHSSYWQSLYFFNLDSGSWHI